MRSPSGFSRDRSLVDQFDQPSVRELILRLPARGKYPHAPATHPARRRFQAALLDAIDRAKILGVRAGARSTHRIIGIWAVVVDGRAGLCPRLQYRAAPRGDAGVPAAAGSGRRVTPLLVAAIVAATSLRATPGPPAAERQGRSRRIRSAPGRPGYRSGTLCFSSSIQLKTTRSSVATRLSVDAPSTITRRVRSAARS